jgi:endonuclease/exonuclease/phosphatase family metal-dependent hydrolase
VSSQLALLVTLIEPDRSGKLCRTLIINTHLKAKPEFERVRVDQIEQLLSRLEDEKSDNPIIICADLNSTPDSNVLHRLQNSNQFENLVSAYPTVNDNYSTFKRSVVNGSSNTIKRRIDYILARNHTSVKIVPAPVSALNCELPHAEFPSDHLWLAVDVV